MPNTVEPSQSQTIQILRYLQRGNPIDPMVALRLFRCFRLAARIAEVKQYGIGIRKVMVKNRQGARFARYSLA